MTDEDFLSEVDLMKVRASEAKAHSELCSVQTYCLNGGTCYRLQSLAMHYCVCPDNFEGRRCHTKKMGEFDEVKEGGSLNWNTIRPLVIVIGGVFLCVLALLCIYFAISFCCKLYRNRCGRKGKYRLAHPGSSDLHLVIEENSKDDSSDTRASPKSRARLAACSSSPETARPPIGAQGPTASQDLRSLLLHAPRPSNDRSAATDVELGRSGPVTAFVLVNSAGKPSSPSTDSGRTAGRRPSPKIPPVTGTAVANGRSPNDSNNNNNNNDGTSSARVTAREPDGRQPTHFAHQDTLYHPVSSRNDALLFSDSPSSPKQSDPHYDDTDPESTAV